MALHFSARLLASAGAVGLLSVTLSVLVSALLIYLSADNLQDFRTQLSSALRVAATVPLLVSIPISYYIFLQRDELRRLNGKLASLLRQDELTGLLSRRAFLAEAAEALRTARLSERASALLYVDLDRFKSINDRFGHAVGDEAIRLFGSLAAQTKHPGDIVGRLGGEEFCLLMPSCSPEQARQRAEALVDGYRSQAIEIAGHRVDGTLSVGVAVCDETADLDQMIAVADGLLYEAKRCGRDRVVMGEAINSLLALADTLRRDEPDQQGQAEPSSRADRRRA